MNKHLVGWLVFAVSLLASTGRAQSILASDSTWGVYDADPAVGPATYLGPAQLVCLNPSTPSPCPPDAVAFCSGTEWGTSWQAPIAGVPGASWIWAPGITGTTIPADGAEFFFAKQLFLLPPLGGSLDLAADNEAELFINGVPAAPVVTDQDSLTTIDLSPFLSSGLTWITVRAKNADSGSATNDYCMNPAGVVFGGTLTTPACSVVGASESPRLGSPPNPGAFLPGTTTPPIVGGVWDPIVDHTSFLPTADLDFLGVSPTPLNAPSPWGTLLCDPATALLYTAPAPGQPFQIAVPAQCSLVGVSACTQAASFAVIGGQIQLTNALDITIGTF